MKTDDPFEPVSTPGRKPYRFPPGLYHLCAQKADLSRLDVRAEAEALSVEFAAASPRPRGWLPCRAVGRVYHNPWAALTVGSDGLGGLSRDLGGLEGRAPSFFDLAVTTGRFPDRESAVRHYAERTGVGIPPEGSGGPHAAPSLEDRVAWIPAIPPGPEDLDLGAPRAKKVRRPACLRCPEVPRVREPRSRVVLVVPRGSPGRFERPRRPADLRCCRAKSVKKNARGFFLARWGEVLGSRKKLQGKDLQK